MKKLANILVALSIKLFRAFVSAGRLPKEQKKAILVPLFKVGSKADAVNYWVSLVIGKAMEHLISIRLSGLI